MNTVSTHRNETYLTNKKAIISGNVLEIYEYEKPILKNSKMKRNKGRSTEGETDSLTKLKNRKKVANRARAIVRRYANANPQLNKFITLTFAENVTDIEYASKCFNSFRTYVQQDYSNFEYIKVIEFQKRGAIHFHMLCNLPYIPQKVFALYWKYGFSSIMRVDNIDNVGAYITKYMCKDIDDRLQGKKCFSKSYTLVPPTLVEDNDLINDLEDELPPVIRKLQKAYETEHFGIIIYKQYVCKGDIRSKLDKIVALQRRHLIDIFDWIEFQDEFPF